MVASPMISCTKATFFSGLFSQHHKNSARVVGKKKKIKPKSLKATGSLILTTWTYALEPQLYAVFSSASLRSRNSCRNIAASAAVPLATICSTGSCPSASECGFSFGWQWSSRTLIPGLWSLKVGFDLEVYCSLYQGTLEGGKPSPETSPGVPGKHREMASQGLRLWADLRPGCAGRQAKQLPSRAFMPVVRDIYIPSSLWNGPSPVVQWSMTPQSPNGSFQMVWGSILVSHKPWWGMGMGVMQGNSSGMFKESTRLFPLSWKADFPSPLPNTVPNESISLFMLRDLFFLDIWGW